MTFRARTGALAFASLAFASGCTNHVISPSGTKPALEVGTGEGEFDG